MKPKNKFKKLKQNCFKDKSKESSICKPKELTNPDSLVMK